MKQVVQNLRSGVLELLDVGCPRVGRGQVLIQTRASLISAGTERFLVEFGKASLLTKARQNPDRVKQVLAKIKTDGLLPTLEAVFNKLDEPLPLGYCNAGIVVEVGADVTQFSIGDRVASNGHHAELVAVPVNLCAKVPDGVTDDDASFAVLGAIALQGIRLVQPTLGETVVVFGLGLVGLMAVQMLLANGTRVIGIDLDPSRLQLAESFGAQVINPGQGADAVATVLAATHGQGADAVLITASAKNDSIVSQSAQMSRKRGRIVLVGVVNLDLQRAEFYEKELTFQVSCSYGPGRYDEAYEEEGIDYPLPFVRWTEQRNIAAVLDLIGRRRMDVAALTSHRIAHADAVQAYELITSGKTALGVVLQYPTGAPSLERTIPARVTPHTSSSASRRVTLGMIGAGGFTKSVLLPALAKTPAVLHTIASSGGVSGAHAARKFGFQHSTTDYRSMLADDRINTIFITTRHDQHARMVTEALQAGKHVFVEKPLAIDHAGLKQIQDAYAKTSGLQLMVGFNRRFSPHILQVQQCLRGRSGPLCMTMLVNAGTIPPDHWTQDRRVGGGRMIGEGCHWIDLLAFLAGSSITRAQSVQWADVPGALTRDDHCSASFEFQDGSIGTLQYFANGHRAFPKERLTVFSDGRVLEMDNFRRVEGYGFSRFRRFRTYRQDKGHQAECLAFVTRVAEGGPPLIPFESLINVTEASFQCAQLADATATRSE